MKLEIYVLFVGMYIPERDATVLSVESNGHIPFGKITDGNIDLEVIGIDSFCSDLKKQLILVRGKHNPGKFIGRTFYVEI